MKKEIWKDITYCDGKYQVSNMGRVRSLNFRMTKGLEKILTPSLCKNDKTDRVQISVSVNGKRTYIPVHCLVAEFFIGEKPKGYYVCHIDGDRTNNSAYNLKYDTPTENNIDVYRYGGKNGKSKLEIKDIMEIRKRYDNGEKCKDIGSLFKIDNSQVSRIGKRKFFKWLNEDGTIKESKTAIYYKP